MDARDMKFAEQFARLPELLGPGQVADVAGVHDEGRRLRQCVDVGDGAAQAADHVGIRRLVEADMGIADLDEGEGVLRGGRDASGRGRAERARHATGQGPDDGGTAPGGQAAESLAALRVFEVVVATIHDCAPWWPMRSARSCAARFYSRPRQSVTMTPLPSPF